MFFLPQITLTEMFVYMFVFLISTILLAVSFFRTRSILMKIVHAAGCVCSALWCVIYATGNTLLSMYMFPLMMLTGIEKVKSIFGKHLLSVRHWILLVASYIFYGWWDWRFCFLLLFVTATSYITALFVSKKIALSIGVIIPLVVLGFFKYFNFFLDSFE